METNIKQIADLKELEGASIEGEVVEVREVKKTTNKKGQTIPVQECVVEDMSGSIILNLWEKDCDTLNIGDKIRVSNGYCTVYKESLRISRGKYGVITKT